MACEHFINSPRTPHRWLLFAASSSRRCGWARLPHCSLPLDAVCLSGVQRLHWVMIPNQNNYNNCLCEGNQIKGFGTLGRDHTSRMFSSGSWKRLRCCFLCSSLREYGRAVLGLSLSPTLSGLGVFTEGEGPFPPPSSLGGREKRKSLWISLGVLFIFKTSKPKAQPLSKHRRKQSMGGIAGHTCIGGSQPRGSWVVTGRGGKMSLYLAKRACPMGERNQTEFPGASQDGVRFRLTRWQVCSLPLGVYKPRFCDWLSSG